MIIDEQRCLRIGCRKKTYGALCCSLECFELYGKNKKAYKNKKKIKEIKEAKALQIKSTISDKKEYLESLKPVKRPPKENINQTCHYD
jgi:hypothetical protein